MDPATETPEQPKVKKPSFFKSPLHLAVLLVVLVALIIAAVAVGQHKDTTETPPPVTSNGSPELSLSPSTQTVSTGDTLTIAVWEDSGKQSVNAVQADVTYPSTSFDLVNVETTGSAFDVQAESTNTSGKVVIARGHIGELVGRQLVAKINLKATTAAKDLKVSFVDGSVLLSSTSNKDILSQKVGGTYTVEAK